jgi:hypothetical protein
MNDFEISPSKVRFYDLENGNKLRLTNTDPYGFITFSLEHGQLPVHLAGACWTDWRTAEIAANKYIGERQSVVAEQKHKEPIKKVG